MDNSLDLHHNLFGRLESLSRCILERKLGTVQDVWQFEIDLMKFQIEQQRAINTERKNRRDINARLKECSDPLELDTWRSESRDRYNDEPLQPN